MFITPESDILDAAKVLINRGCAALLVIGTNELQTSEKLVSHSIAAQAVSDADHLKL